MTTALRVSTAPAAKAALLRALETWPALRDTGVRVVWGAAVNLPGVYEIIYLTDTRDISNNWVNLGAGRIDEEYTLALLVECYASGDDLQALEERWWQVCHEIAAAIREDVSLAGTVFHARPELSSQQSGPVDDTTVLSRGELMVHCRARV